MWDQCARAHGIPPAHEIDGIGANDSFLPYEMEVVGCG
jgi:hypothetical protein